MVEIAIAVAVIAFALVAIIGVLPAGLQVQKENREETIISQDGVFFMDAIRSGAGVYLADGIRNSWALDDLTNYVIRIETNGVPTTAYQTGADIIGLLSTPSFTAPVTNRAIVRAISGTLSELGPAVTDVGFQYLLEVQVLPFDPMPVGPQPLQDSLKLKLHEVRLLFRWPVLKAPPPNSPLANSKLGSGRQILRTLVSGNLDPYTNASAAYYFLRP